MIPPLSIAIGASDCVCSPAPVSPLGSKWPPACVCAAARGSAATRPAAAIAPISAALLFAAREAGFAPGSAAAAPVANTASASTPVEPSARVKLPVPTTLTSPPAAE